VFVFFCALKLVKGDSFLLKFYTGKQKKVNPQKFFFTHTYMCVKKPNIANSAGAQGGQKNAIEMS
jgi:hypothetical protein